MPGRVFISHSSEDKNLADAICHAIEARGIPCWIAPRDIPTGAEWSASIVQAIKEASLMVLAFSERANQSDFVYREVERAAHHGLKILPVRLDDVVPSERLELFIGVSHWLDAMDRPLKKQLERICDEVEVAILANPDPASAPPTRTQTLPPPKRRAPARSLLVGSLIGLTAAGLGVAYFMGGKPDAPPAPEPVAGTTPPAEPASTQNRIAPTPTPVPAPSGDFVRTLDPPGLGECTVSIGNLTKEQFNALNPIVNDHENMRGPEASNQPFRVGPVTVSGTYGLPNGHVRNAANMSGGRRSLTNAGGGKGMWAYAAQAPDDPSANYLFFSFTPLSDRQKVHAVGLGWIGRMGRGGNTFLSATVGFADGTTLSAGPLELQAMGKSGTQGKDAFVGFEDKDNHGGIVSLEVRLTQTFSNAHPFNGWDDLGLVLK